MQARRYRIAFDRASVRTKSKDGHLHIASSVVSSACVSDYLGSEIPHRDLLGLKADRTYALLRDPVALEKAVPSLHGKPLVIRHREQTAGDHDREITVGSVSNPRWEYPNVMAEITVWDGDAIALIESGEQADLSCGYFYQAIMERGRFNGVEFAGRMIDITFNHIALVDVGRVSNAVVGDSAAAIRKGAKNMANANAKKALEALEQFLQEKMSTEDFAASSDYVTELMRCCSQNEDGSARDDEKDDSDMAGDLPPSFPGRPTPGGKMVGDRGRITSAAQRSFAKLFPGALPVTHI